MTPQEYRERYAGLNQSQVRELVKTDAAFREVTEELYAAVFRARLNKGCPDCWVDAYILLMKADKVMEKANTQFELKAGALLVDVVNGDNAKLTTRHNLTDELALYHLSTNPGYLPLFSKVPDNLEEQLLEYVNRQNAGATAAEKPAEAPVDAPESTEAPEGDKTLASGEDAPKNAPKTPDDLLSEAEARYKKARTAAKGFKTKLANLEAAPEPDAKKIAYAKESLEKAVAALEEAAKAYREAAVAAGKVADIEGEGEKPAEAPEQPAQEQEKPAEEAEKPEGDGEKPADEAEKAPEQPAE